MLVIKDPEHFAQVMQFALQYKAANALIERLEYLHHYADNSTVCELYSDWAPNSFAFVMKAPNGERWFNGGLIYRGPGQPLDGSAPAFTVSLSGGLDDDQPHAWSIHT